MKLTNMLLALLLLLQAALTIITYDTWRMDKEFFENLQEEEQEQTSFVNEDEDYA